MFPVTKPACFQLSWQLCAVQPADQPDPAVSGLLREGHRANTPQNPPAGPRRGSL